MKIASILWQYLKTRYQKPFRSREELVDWQNRQVSAYLDRVIPQSSFYREYNKQSHDWRTFPIIDKASMMEHFDQLNTLGIRKKEAYQLAIQAEKTRDFTPMINQVTIGLSSGTSGHRGLFLVSEQERYRWAGAMLAKILPGSLWGNHRAALFLRANSNLYTSVQQGRIQFRYFDLMDPMEEHLQPLERFQPTLLLAPPSVLRYLAEEKRHGRCHIEPQKVISVADVLDSLDETIIETAFDQIVHQIYQCTEGFLATTCAYGTLHMNEDLLVIQKEVIDEKTGKFSPIITDFSRTTQPIIRYRLNDILVEKQEPCPCQSPFMAIESIEGRCDDIFYLPIADQQRYQMIFPDFIRHAILTAHPDIEEYSVIQHELDQWEVSLQTPVQKTDEIHRAVVLSLQELCLQYQCQIPDMVFSPYIRKPHMTKNRRVKRSCSAPPHNVLGGVR